MIWTEWDKLTEIIVGSTYDTKSLEQFDDTQFVDSMSKILEETEQDFQALWQCPRLAPISSLGWQQLGRGREPR